MAYDGQPDVTRYRSRDPHTEAEAREFITAQENVEVGLKYKWLHLAVERRAVPGMIGTVCIKILSQPNGLGEIGWFLNPEHHGQGYAMEASRALIDFAFDTLGLHRLTAHCDVRNERSYKLMERLGMRREGTLVESVFYDGAWQSQHSYALLEHERTE